MLERLENNELDEYADIATLIGPSVHAGKEPKEPAK